MKLLRIIGRTAHAFMKARKSKSSPSHYHLLWDGENISLVERPTGQIVREFRWGDVEFVGYLVTDAGPWFDDDFLVLKVKMQDKLCCLSIEWEGVNVLANYIDSLSKRTYSCGLNESIIVWPPSRAGETIPGLAK